MKSRTRPDKRKSAQIWRLTGVLVALAGTSVFWLSAGIPAADAKDKGNKEKAAAEKQAPAEPEQSAPSAATVQSQKLLKTIKTPFGSNQGGDNADCANDGTADPLSLLALSPQGESTHRLSLSQRLNPPQLFLPGHMILGKTVEFTVKGKPGSYAALALADKDTGAKPICGHKLRLGADRKVVAAVEIPASGMATISVDTPIEGDLIGLCLYFEAAVWSKPDFSDVEIANVVPSERQESAPNGVLIAADTIVKKKGIKIGAGSTSPLSTYYTPGTGMDSGKP